MTDKEFVLSVYPNARLEEASSLRTEHGFQAVTGYPEHNRFTFLVADTEEEAWSLAREAVHRLALYMMEES